MTHTSVILSAEQLGVRRGERELLREFSLTLRAGEGVHLLGANGAGKTSLLRVLAGIAHADQGRVKLSGNLLYIGHSLGLKGELTVVENLLVYARLAAVQQPLERIENALHRIGLLGFADHLVLQLSAGQKRRVALSRLLIEPASLWLLDEPFAALDVKTTQWLCNELDHFMSRGAAVLLTSHQSVVTRMPLRELSLESL